MINITFSKLVKMNGRLWEVNFRKQPGTDEVFHGDTPDLQGQRFHFTLVKTQGGKWQIGGAAVPEWLMNALEPLANAAEKGMEEFQERYAHRMCA